MRVDILSKEYPPEVYGGAGVHVAELVRALRARDDVEAHVHAFGALRDEPLTSSYADLAELSGANAALRGLRSRPLAHLVRQLRRPPGLAAARRAARRLGALARAAATVEGRAARRR